MRRGLTLLLLAAALAVSIVAGLALGAVRIPPGQVLDIVLGGPGARGAFASIVWDVRMPRVLLGAVVGAGLAVTGAVLQALVRNPLADPFLLGASSGASAGAVLVIVSGAGAAAAAGGLGLPAAAFAGSLAALLAVYALARRGGTMTTGRLILAGVAVQYVLSALTSLVLVLSAKPDQLRTALFWTLGGLGGARWDELALPAAALLAGTALLTALARPLDLLLAGEEGARTLGLDTGRFRAAVFVLASLVVGVLVAYSGAIGFVGLMVPHAARMAVGAGHRALLPVAALAGAVFLVLADLVARTAAAPEEVPVGVVTALVGGPFFLWMLRRTSRTEGVAG
ncbi:FecCD family ABC transporter permease [Streptomyces lavendulae]|uniref:FecCD family ABC transporter permease n=1 Tax=Streptomyces lavendulae TaxID=1914 RepID=UPI00249FAA27|nr:iron ABC transporter permease [Streptomyces lavendulae]GLX17226.1 ABC transporter permease [Streptomyces lavendulae subsp. lavendulae]GLX24915.1 ABC transporter permease [Streptomyces lavendulae subsp. lavendulae]